MLRFWDHINILFLSYILVVDHLKKCMDILHFDIYSQNSMTILSWIWSMIWTLSSNLSYLHVDFSNIPSLCCPCFSFDEFEAKFKGASIWYLSLTNVWHIVVLRFEKPFIIFLLVLWMFLSFAWNIVILL